MTDLIKDQCSARPQSDHVEPREDANDRGGVAEINARLAVQRLDGFGGLKDWLYTYRAHLMDTGYHGFKDVPVLRVEAWLEAIEEAQATIRRALLGNTASPGSACEPDGGNDDV